VRKCKIGTAAGCEQNVQSGEQNSIKKPNTIKIGNHSNLGSRFQIPTLPSYINLGEFKYNK